MPNSVSKSQLRKLTIEQLEANKLVALEIGKTHLAEVIQVLIDEKVNPRYPKRFVGKKMRADKKNVRELKQIFTEKGIEVCEICGTDNGLSFAHSRRRRNIHSEEMMKEVALLCIPDHQELERLPEAEMTIKIREIIALRGVNSYA